MIKIIHKGSFKNTERFLDRALHFNVIRILNKYGQLGVEALSSATPIESGETASSWSYTIEGSGGSYTIVWTNSHMNQGYSIALLIQYGHGTGTGGYVPPNDYINPAIQPIMDRLASDFWNEIRGL